MKRLLITALICSLYTITYSTSMLTPAPCACSTEKATCLCAHKNCCDMICECILKGGTCLCPNHKEQENMVTAAIAYGELVDKITILEIKSQRISDKQKLINVHNELSLLNKIFFDLVALFPNQQEEIRELKDALYAINNEMWDIEDIIRAKEAAKNFDEEFIRVARAVYKKNDERGALKRRINLLLNSPLIEEKCYTLY